MTDWEKNEEIKLFQEYLRIPSVHPNIDYAPCVDFLRRQAEELGLEFKIEIPVTPKKPIVILTWVGTQPELESIVLNSHMDVVPVFEEHWTHKPFSAHMDEKGRIYARGSQDMKCVATQYLGAIRHFKKNKMTFKRTIHATFVPEEEVGGFGGMREFVHSDEFKALNVGFSFDEGLASENDVYNVYYAERAIWHVLFKVNGTPGHGSLFLKNTAGEKMTYLLDRFMEFRVSQVQALAMNPEMTIGDITTINITQMNGGVQDNVVPPQFQVMIDIRIAITVDHQIFENMFKKWCEDAGGYIVYDYLLKEPFIQPTKIDDSNYFWTTFKKSVDELGLKIRTLVLPGGTDARYIRSLGIPCIGFSPMINTPLLLHAHNEYLQADVYLHGLELYKKIIADMANA